MPYETSGTLKTGRTSPIDETIEIDATEANLTNLELDNSTIRLQEVVTIPSSAIHRWSVSEGSGDVVGDSIGNLDGTRNNATWLSSSSWQDGYAFDFGPTESDINCGYASEFDNPPFAVALTIEPYSLDANARLIDLFAGGSSGWGIKLNDSDGTTVETSYMNSSGDNHPLQGATTLSVDTKYRIVFNLAPSGTVAIYLNGSEDASGTGEGYSETDGTLDFLWGKNNQGGGEFDGVIDDVVFYGQTLSEAEIQDDLEVQPWYGGGGGGDETSPRLSGQPVTSNTLLSY